MASTEYMMLEALVSELLTKTRQFSDDPQACRQMAAKLQNVLGLTAQDVVSLTQKHFDFRERAYGYVEKVAKADPPPGKLVRLPLADALREVSVELVESSQTTGMLLRCLRCGGVWRPEGYKGGDLGRPVKGFWKCPAGCNASAGPLLWDENKPPSYNPLSGYK